MKCKSLSFSARKRSMMDACQARDESRAELEMAIYINKLCSMCQRAHPEQLPVNSQKADFGEQLSTGLSKTLHESLRSCNCRAHNHVFHSWDDQVLCLK